MSNRGGVRKGAGRKPSNPERGAKSQATILLYPDSWEYLSSLGGTLSEEIQKLVDEAQSPREVKVVKKKVKDPEQLWKEYCATLDYHPNIQAKNRWMQSHGF